MNKNEWLIQIKAEGRKLLYLFNSVKHMTTREILRETYKQHVKFEVCRAQYFKIEEDNKEDIKRLIQASKEGAMAIMGIGEVIYYDDDFMEPLMLKRRLERQEKKKARADKKGTKVAAENKTKTAKTKEDDELQEDLLRELYPELFEMEEEEDFIGYGIRDRETEETRRNKAWSTWFEGYTDTIRERARQWKR